MADQKKAGMISGMSPLAVLTGDELMEVSSRQKDGTWKTFSILVNKIRTNQGLSAYEVAVVNGFQGTQQEWLDSLKGQSAYKTAVDLGFEGTEAEWLDALVGPSAFQAAKDNGFTGTEAEWLESLKGQSAYQIAKANGYKGTEPQWLASLVGKSAYQIAKELDPTIGTEAQWLKSLVGDSAYEVAVANGFQGNEAAWLNSLKGKSAYEIWVAQGNTGNEAAFIASLKGESAYQSWLKQPGNAGKSEAVFVASLKGDKGTDGTNGLSAYQTWLAQEGNAGKTEAQFLKSLEGKSAYQTWLTQSGNAGKSEADFIASLKGEKGANGLSAYEVAKAGGYTGTQAEWVASLKGADGRSAYEVAKANGYTGTEAQWLASLKGKDGTNGTNGKNGEDGRGVNILANIDQDTFNEIVASGEALEGDGYIVDKFMYIFNGTDWVKSNSIMGPQGKGLNYLGQWGDNLALPLGSNYKAGDTYVWRNSLWTLVEEPERKWVDIGVPGPEGKSAYQSWLAQSGNAGKTEAEFVASLKGKQGDIGPIGPDGKTAYQLAVAKGFEGTEAEWLASLKGDQGEAAVAFEIEGQLTNPSQLPRPGDAKKAYLVNKDLYVWLPSKSDYLNLGSLDGDSAYEIWVTNGGQGDEQAFLNSLKGASAYQVAQANGFQGNQAQWLESLKGQSTYQLAVANGFTGTEAQYLESLKGKDGRGLQVKGEKANEAAIKALTNPAQQDAWVAKDTGHLWIYTATAWIDAGEFRGKDGTDGTDGKNAYEVAQANGFTGTEAEWLASLKGENGRNVTITGSVAIQGDLPANAAAQDAYTVRANGHLYMYIGNAWVDLGQFKGDKGDEGAKGPAGMGINIVSEVELKTDLPAPSTLKAGDAVFVMEDHKLYQVNQAGQYNPGIHIAGPQGEDGKEGPQGPAGTSIAIMGSYGTEAALNAAHPTGNPGEGYLIGDDLYLYGVDPKNPQGMVWYNAGPVRGPQGLQGIQGIRGLRGLTGEQGKRGSLWLNIGKLSEPSKDYGEEGDWAVNDQLSTWYKDVNGWVYVGPLKAGDINSPDISLGKVVREGTAWVKLPVDAVPNPVSGKQYVMRGQSNGTTVWGELSIPASGVQPVENPVNGKQYVMKGGSDGKAVWTELSVPASGVPEVPANTTVPQGRTSTGWVSVMTAPTGTDADRDYVLRNGAFIKSGIQVDAPATADLGVPLCYQLDAANGKGKWVRVGFDTYTLKINENAQTTSFTPNFSNQQAFRVDCTTTTQVTVTLPAVTKGRTLVAVFEAIGMAQKINFVSADSSTSKIGFNNNIGSADIEYGAVKTVLTAFWDGFDTWIISKGPSY